MKLEKKFGKFAIRNLPIKIAVVMAISYILWAFVPTFAVKLVFSPYAIMEQHQFWRLFTWVFSPPGDLNLVGILMIFILILFGQQIEQAMGTFMFNLYIWCMVLEYGHHVRHQYLLLCKWFHSWHDGCWNMGNVLL